MTYSILVFGILLFWKFRKNKKEEIRVLRIALSFIAALGLGAFLEIFLNLIIAAKIPSMAHLFILMPLSVLFYEIKRNHVMPESEDLKKVSTGVILSEFEQLRFYQYLSSLFILISIVYMIIQTILLQDHYSSVQFSLSLLVTGTILLFLPRIVINGKDRDNIMLVTVNISILMIMAFLSNQEIYNYAWTFPIPIIFISILYNKKHLLYSVASVSVLGNIWLMILSKEPHYRNMVLIYLPKILFFIVSAFIASYIHKVYLNRLNENESRIAYQEMISRISSSLVTISHENQKECFESILEELGLFSNAREAFLVCCGKENRSIQNIYNWGIGGNPIDWELPPEVSEYKFDQFLQLMMAENPVYIEDLNLLPSDFDWFKKMFHPSVTSLVAVSEIREGHLYSILGLNFSNPIHPISIKEMRQIMGIPSNLIADGLLKIENEQKISFMAYYDALTGLPNRLFFFDQLDKALALADRTEKTVAVIMMDLDSFKYINDTMGHDAGDLLLRRVAETLSSRIRDYDTMSRFGGDEFLFILSQLNNQNEAAAIAEKLLQALVEPISLAGEKFYITGSLGISCFPGDGKNGELLFKNADTAMYVSKGEGKNRYTFFSQEMNKTADEKMQLSNELYRALERDEFVLNYQPQTDISGTKIIGMEALIRWNHPEKGLLPPLDFIPLAEDIGLINDIGKWVLYKACKDNKDLQDRGGPCIRVAVNLSVKQFSGSSLVDMVKETLYQSELKPEYLELEITESIAMGDFTDVQQVLKNLRELGITLSIDDFGTEYSSLSRLRHLPVDRIKIDKQFIQGISKSTHDESITSFIIALSKSMGLKVIAEGVESNSQISFLTEKSCDEIQGFYFYKPMEFEKLLDVFEVKA
ncbi:putative bifunctional diguanylate cyclase/phosphodiesterase [Oceanispirochaeta crateris]|nr:EAL domain-containing protein [Oceanispirochaeta crateris]